MAGPREGQPRSYFRARTVLKGSPEEDDHRKELAADSEAEKQQQLVAIKRQQEIDSARLAAEQELAMQKAEAAAAEETRQQKLEKEKLAAEQAAGKEKAEAEASSLAKLNDNIRNLLVAQLPSWWKLGRLDVSDAGRTAVSGQSSMVQNFTATISLNEDLFSWGSESVPVKLVTRVLPAGEERRIEGTATSTRLAEGWQTSLTVVPPMDFAGEPRSYFTTKTIVRGTPEEEEHHKVQAAAGEAERQQQLAAIKHQEELESARLAAEQKLSEQKAEAAAAEQARQQKMEEEKLIAEQALTKQKADAEAAEQAHRQKLEDERRVRKEKQLGALTAVLSGSDVVKRQAAVKAALANGDEDELSIVLAEALAQGPRQLSGSVTLSDCDGKKQMVTPFSVTISDFDRSSGGFRFEWRFSFGLSGNGKGSLQGVMLGMAGDSNWIFKGRFDGQAKVIGDMGSPYNQMCNFSRVLPAEVTVF